jgi:hypothetical protein
MIPPLSNSEQTMIRVARAKIEIAACPLQISGITEDGQSVFLSYRWGQLTIHVSDETENGWCLIQKIGGKNDGYLDLDAIREITAKQMEWPAELD